MKANNPRTIVAAMDTTDTSRGVFKEALVLASSSSAHVVLVAVTPHYEGNMNRMCIKNAEEQFSKPFRNMLDEAKQYAGSLGLEVETIHRRGKPSDEISAVAEEKRAHLLLLGCSHRTQVERMLLGRTMLEILYNCSCDVLLIPEGGEVGFGKVVVGVNGRPGSLTAAKRALDVAACYGSELHALHVIDLPPDKSLRYGVQQEAERKGRTVLHQIEQLGADRQQKILTSQCQNSPERGLTEYAADQNIQLIVLGLKPHSGLLGNILDSVVEGVAARTNCPVLVTRNAEAPHLFT